MVIKKKAIKWNDYWAETICRKKFQGKDHFFAYVKRMHSYDDVVMDQGSWVGLVERPVTRMVLDKDEESDTYGKRVEEVNKVEYQDGTVKNIPVLLGTKFEYTFPVTPENIANFKKMCTDTIHGSTQLIWCLTSKNYSCEYPEDFWTNDIKDIEDAIRKRRSIRSAPTEGT